MPACHILVTGIRDPPVYQDVDQIYSSFVICSVDPNLSPVTSTVDPKSFGR